MSAEQNPATLGYSTLGFADLVERDLKANISPDEQEYLQNNIQKWRDELLTLKRRTEMGFTSSKARTASQYRQYRLNELTYEEYLNLVTKERIWRVNASRFLLQVEARLQQVRTPSAYERTD